MPVLTYTELDNSLRATLIPKPNYNTFIFDYFKNLYHTGCRPNELIEVNRWTYISSSQIILDTAKDNNNRTFTVADLTPEFVRAIQEQFNIYMTTNTKKFRYLFEKWYSYPAVFKGMKQSNLYLFRYRYVKNLHLNGSTPDQIRNVMGWTSLAMVFRYVDAVLEY